MSIIFFILFTHFALRQGYHFLCHKKLPLRRGSLKLQKTVIPSQCAHWRGNLPVKRNIFDTKNAGFPKILGIATPVCGLVRDDRSLSCFIG